MDEWRNAPMEISQIPAGMKLALFIDESGKAKYKGTTENDCYFTLGGCLFSTDAMKEAQDKLLALKKKYWADGNFAYKKGLMRVTFHMCDISKALKHYRSRNNPFSSLNENLQPFYNEYKQIIADIDFIVFSVTVDKQAMLRRYSVPYDPYGFALMLLLERVHHCIAGRFPQSTDSVVVMLESIGAKEDSINLRMIKSIIDRGTPYQQKECFDWVKGVFFCPKHSSDGRSYYGLEIADFCAYPIKMYYVKNETTNDEFNIIRPKIYCKGDNKASFGLKKVP